MGKDVDSSEDPDDEPDNYEPEEFEYSPEQDDPGVFWCPKCGAEMYGDSTRCAKCGDFVTPGARPKTAIPWWIWLGIILVGSTLAAGLVAALARR